MRFNTYVKKDKLSFYVWFVLTDQNTISEFLTNTVSITLHQNKHFTQKQHTFIIHLYNSSSLQYIHLYNIRLNKQTIFISTIFLSIQNLYFYIIYISTKLSQQSYLDKAILKKLSWKSYLNKNISHLSFLMHNSNSF